MIKHTAPRGGSLPLAIFFSVFIVGIILASLTWKGVGYLKKGTFDGKHQFILSTGQDNKASLIAVNPDTQSATILSITGSFSLKDIGKTTEIPIDSQVKQTFNGNVSSFFQEEIFNKNATIPFIDKIRLWWFVRTLSTGDVTMRDMHLPDSQDAIDTGVGKLFTDRSMYQEANTITIINASGENGLGSRFSKLLSTIGGNVIMVSTSEEISKTSQILYGGDNSYTVSRIERILRKKATQDTKKSSISDITVIIGEDLIKTQAF